MGRQEDFEKKAKQVTGDKPELISGIAYSVFLEAAEYGCQYAVEKACEWLESLSGYVVCGQKANVENFRKAMEL